MRACVGYSYLIVLMRTHAASRGLRLHLQLRGRSEAEAAPFYGCIRDHAAHAWRYSGSSVL